MHPETWKTIQEIAGRSWAAIGPLAGVLVGAYLTGRRQKRDWLADNKKEEYRELLSAMSKAINVFIQVYVAEEGRNAADRGRIRAAKSELLEVTQSRLFIVKTMKEVDVTNRWLNIASAFEKTRDSNTFASDNGSLLNDIRAAAWKDVGG